MNKLVMKNEFLNNTAIDAQNKLHQTNSDYEQQETPTNKKNTQNTIPVLENPKSFEKNQEKKIGEKSPNMKN